MAITNLTVTFADKIDERFAPSTVSNAAVNQDYSWDGSKTIKVSSVSTGTMSDYVGATGFGTPEELANSVQDMLLTKDRKFSILLDKMDENESKVKAGEVLARQLREEVMPEIEAYRFNVMCAGVPVANEVTLDTATQTSYEVFLDANEKLDDAFVPTMGRVAFVSPKFYNLIKKDDSFIKQADLGQNIAITGMVGEIDGVAIVKTNKAWLTDGVKTFDCLIAHNVATVAPIKLAEYRMNTAPERFSGTLFDGRFVYDAFVLDNKAVALASIEDVTV